MSAQAGAGANPPGTQVTASSSSGSGPAPAVQTIPISNNPDNITSSELANAESAFPKPAIYTISIVGGLFGLIVLYKLYKWAWGKHSRRRSLIAANAVRTSYPAGQAEDGRGGGGMMQEVGGTGAGAGLITSSTAPRNYGRLNSYNSLGEFGAGTHTTPSFVFPGSSGTQNSTRSSLLYSEAGSGTPGVLTPSPTTSSPFLPGTYTGTSRPAHPYSTGTPYFIRGDSSMSTDVLRAKGSRASLLAGVGGPGVAAQHRGRRDRRSTLPHSYSGHSSDGRSGGSHQPPYSSTEMLVPASFAAQQQQQDTLSNATSRQSLLAAPAPNAGSTGRRPRISGPPHARHSRIEIVTPAPLGPPPGTIVAVDKATLAFSPLSGIGMGGSETVMGLSDFVVPADGAGSEAGAAAHVGDAAGQRRPGTGASSSTASASNSDSYSAGGGEDYSRPTTAAGQRSGAIPLQTHSRAFSAATTTTSSAAHFSDESASLSSSSSPSPFGGPGGGGSSSGSSPVYEAVPPLPTQYAYAPGGAQTGTGKQQQGPQSPLDKLKLQLEGEARRVGSQYSQ